MDTAMRVLLIIVCNFVKELTLYILNHEVQ